MDIVRPKFSKVYCQLQSELSPKYKIVEDFSYNNVILRVESSRNKSFVTIITWNFILVSLTSIAAPDSAGLSFGSMMPSHLMYLSLYALDFSWRERMARKNGKGR